MPAKLSTTSATVSNIAVDVGEQIRAQRKALGVSATTAAEAAGMSRVTWHRIEKGVTTVTLGACLSALNVVGLDIEIMQSSECEHNSAHDLNNSESIPVKIALADYPQLKQLAWQVHGVDTLTPREALGVYERNSRHINLETLALHERDLIAALQQVFSGGSNNV